MKHIHWFNQRGTTSYLDEKEHSHTIVYEKHCRCGVFKMTKVVTEPVEWDD